LCILLMLHAPPRVALFPYTTLFRSVPQLAVVPDVAEGVVLRRALEEGEDLVVGVVQATGEGGGVVTVPRGLVEDLGAHGRLATGDRKSTRLNSSHVSISYAVFCLKK